MADAMGIATYVLLPWAAKWRWQLDRADSPWYPGMTLLRQIGVGASFLAAR